MYPSETPMRKQKKERPAVSKEKIPKFDRLDGNGTVYLTTLCDECKQAYAIKSWDTQFGQDIKHFCRGECLYVFVKGRQQKDERVTSLC